MQVPSARDPDVKQNMIRPVVLHGCRITISWKSLAKECTQRSTIRHKSWQPNLPKTCHRNERIFRAIKLNFPSPSVHL